MEAEEILDRAWKKLGGEDFIVACVTDEDGNLDRKSRNIPAVLALFGRRVRTRVDVTVSEWADILGELDRVRALAPPVIDVEVRP